MPITFYINCSNIFLLYFECDKNRKLLQMLMESFFSHITKAVQRLQIIFEFPKERN